MGTKFDKTRRKFLKLGVLLSGIVCLNKIFAKNIKNNIKNIATKHNTKNNIIGIRLWDTELYTRIIFESKFEADIKYFELENPHRLVIDFYDCDIIDRKNIISHINKSNIIHNIKLGQFSPKINRFVFYLKVPIKLTIERLDPLDFNNIHYKNRLILNLYYQKLKTEANIPYEDDLLTLLSQNDVIEPNRNQIKLLNNKITNKPIVVIDPGHGGEDPGAIGINGIKEKDIVLDIAKKLQDLINDSNQMVAKLTRTKDVFIPLEDRVKYARIIRADLFISIHADAFTSNIPHGASVFILSQNGVTSSFAKWLANSQNASDEIGGVKLSKQSKVVGKILLDMTQTWTKSQSYRIATKLLNNLSQEVKVHSKFIEEANFVVLRASDVPSILVETAFLSNKDDAYQLATPSFRTKIANIIYKSILEFQKN
jgi:N-acetylmuramoyl-L-alanine amidase